MAILKIARMGHPVLTRSAAAVADPSAPEIRRLVADMIETMSDAEGLGLAAPQVHVAKRLVVFHTPHPGEEGEDEDEEDWSRLTVLVNPVVEAVGEAREDGWEGCLSVPGLRGLVSRYARVRYRGVTPDGEAIDRTVGGMHARIVQHECDHLDGILYPMRMTDLSKLVFESETRHYRGGAAEGAEDAEGAEGAEGDA